ncbi:hypothetical protein CK203_082159 [Vitis vinifera]|uniref:Pentatricopeptide repeat-containing protein n=1 Tax=Vitis vinifera TaxID=29760 RepID=A0A438CMP3_VITVI|nr:hypothetical protein CK203_082159 [Vitis vinifera]
MIGGRDQWRAMYQLRIVHVKVSIRLYMVLFRNTDSVYQNCNGQCACAKTEDFAFARKLFDKMPHKDPVLLQGDGVKRILDFIKGMPKPEIQLKPDSSSLLGNGDASQNGEQDWDFRNSYFKAQKPIFTNFRAAAHKMRMSQGLLCFSDIIQGFAMRLNWR